MGNIDRPVGYEPNPRPIQPYHRPHELWNYEMTLMHKVYVSYSPTAMGTKVQLCTDNWGRT